MTEPSSARRVVYVIEAAERPGIVHAIAAVFAHRGLSMRALIADASRSPPRILVVFHGTGRQCRMVEAVLGRLHNVHSVRMLDEAAPELQATALCRLSGTAVVEDGLAVQPLGDKLLLSGSYAAVERALARLDAEGLLIEAFRTLVAL